MNLHDNTGDRQCMTYTYKYSDFVMSDMRNHETNDNGLRVKVICATHFCGGFVLNKITVMILNIGQVETKCMMLRTKKKIHYR